MKEIETFGPKNSLGGNSVLEEILMVSQKLYRAILRRASKHKSRRNVIWVGLIVYSVAQFFAVSAVSQSLPNCRAIMPGFKTFDDMMSLPNAPTDQRNFQIAEEYKRSLVGKDKSKVNAGDLESELKNIDQGLKQEETDLSSAQVLEADTINLLNSGSPSTYGDEALLYCDAIARQANALLTIQKLKLVRGVLAEILAWKTSKRK